MEGTYDMPYTNPYFFMTTEPNWMGVFAEMQTISYNFIILKHTQINSQLRKMLMLKFRLSFLLSFFFFFFFFFFFLGGGDNLYMCL